ncbi:hypothetical protein NBRC10513v2_005794 [Rhodotorula toruloides]|uniref:FGENESH: predicted gene_6.220 protein n=1 Tax=Rhodotorula toruloides TaxID=5286 RepID=A0A0K3CFU1_RHOTO|nr:hypothetical protein AAT19DRAFT_14725 [Rhodotorula toruloides]
MPAGRTPAAAASALRAFARAARPQPVAAACCAPASASASCSRPFTTSRLARAEPPSSSSSSPPSRPTSAPAPINERGTQLYAPSPSTQHAYLSELVAPLDIPHPDLLTATLAEKALTHKSGVDKGTTYSRRERRGESPRSPQEQGGKQGHNEKLAFIGRRVLRLHFTQFLFSRLSASHPHLLSQLLTNTALSSLSINSILDTKTLGATVGMAWRLQEGLRWRAVRGPDGEMSGLWKCRGSAVEGVVGVVYTTQGIHTTQRLFDEMIYPHLAIPNSVAKALGQSAPASPVAPAIEEDVPLRAAAQA